MNKLIRCEWVKTENQLYVKYHDEEWGKPVYDDRLLFEFLLLESFQAGLSWETILNKRSAFRQAFDAFDYNKIADYKEDKIQCLLENPGIIRNNLKIKAAIKNAQAFKKIQKEWESFSNYLWNFTDHKIIVNRWENIKEVPTSTPLSDKISLDLKKRGFTFVGTTIIYSFLQAIGVICDHTINCFCHPNHSDN